MHLVELEVGLLEVEVTVVVEMEVDVMEEEVVEVDC